MKPKESFECVQCGKLSIDVYWIHPISGWIIKPESGLPWCARCYEEKIREWTKRKGKIRERKEREKEAERKRQTKESVGDIFLDSVEI